MLLKDVILTLIKQVEELEKNQDKTALDSAVAQMHMLKETTLLEVDKKLSEFETKFGSHIDRVTNEIKNLISSRSILDQEFVP